MSKRNEDLKTALTRIVMSTSSIQKGKKSGGVKIDTMKRDIEIHTVQPFSL